MATLFDIDHETGDLSQYDSTVTDGGDLSVEHAAALAGTSWGLSCLIDDSNRLYGVKNQADTGTGKFRARFYINRNDVSIPNSSYFIVFWWHATGASAYVFRYSIRRNASGDWRHYFQPYDDGGVLASINSPMSGEQYVEIYIVQASDAVSADGSVQWWIDGVSQNTWNNVDNFDVFDTADHHRFGISSKPSPPCSGTLYLDQLVANDDGSEIGPVAAAAAKSKHNRGLWIEHPERLTGLRRYSIY